MKFRFTIILTVVFLLTIIPVSAQEPARVRFVNMRIGSTGLDITDQQGAALATLGPFGSVTDFVEVDASTTGLGYSIQTASGFSASVVVGFGPIFSAGGDGLVMIIGDEEEDDILVIDLSAEFGGPDSVADDGLGRLVVIFYVRELTSGAFSLSNAEGTLLGSYFLTAHFDDFGGEAGMLSVALLPGSYTLSATAANDPASALMPDQTLTLAADEVTMVGMVGAYPDAVQTLIIALDGVTLLGE